MQRVIFALDDVHDSSWYSETVRVPQEQPCISTFEWGRVRVGREVLSTLVNHREVDDSHCGTIRSDQFSCYASGSMPCIRYMEVVL